MEDMYSKILRGLPELNEIELEALAGACQKRVEEKRKARREGLRRELMENLQETINDILRNGFSLMIENLDNPNWEVKFLPDESPNIEIEIE